MVNDFHAFLKEHILKERSPAHRPTGYVASCAKNARVGGSTPRAVASTPRTSRDDVFSPWGTARLKSTSPDLASMTASFRAVTPRSAATRDTIPHRKTAFRGPPIYRHNADYFKRDQVINFNYQNSLRR
eukprot:TRINITY_DN22865_c1_g1_i1.p2 TRINITY_DN22865_c1_g1~~TRINITY_DN22865_c1_g1_i1.p2  ORF type:complete len:129 (+),score=14.73 TRINITY_DN22865_c1_g1_i1:89-475(+)